MAFIFFSSFAIHAEVKVRELLSEGVQPQISDSKGKLISLYQNSYALLISVSAYMGPGKKGWRRLTNAGKELDAVAKELQRQGFHVTRIEDPSGVDLHKSLRNFVAKYGKGKSAIENRLVIFFSGHGYSDEGAGYLVPVDAADPHIDPQNFFTHALPITTLRDIAKEIVSRHVLFVLDSCFSGSIFMTKGQEGKPEVSGKNKSYRRDFFLGNGKKKVRQFIAAGEADEELPEISQFIPLFIEAIQGRASFSADGYVTGKEIGQWIEQKLPSLANQKQNPHSDVIPDAHFMFGDIVFQYESASVDTLRDSEAIPELPNIPAASPKRLCQSTQSPQPSRQILTLIQGPEFDDHLSEVLAVAISSDAATLASGDSNGNLWLWDARGRKIISNSIKAHVGSVTGIAFQPFTNNFLATVGRDGMLVLWDLAKRQPKFSAKAHKGGVNSLSFSRDGKKLATAGSDGAIRLWSMSSETVESHILGTHDHPIDVVAIRGDGQIVVAGSSNGTILFWDVDSEVKVPFRLAHSGHISSIALSSDDCTAAIAGYDKNITIWNLTNNTQISTPIVYVDRVKAVTFDRYGTGLLAGTDDGRVFSSEIIGKPTSRQLIDKRESHLGTFAINQDKNLMAIASRKKIVIWRLSYVENKVR